MNCSKKICIPLVLLLAVAVVSIDQMSGANRAGLGWLVAGLVIGLPYGALNCALSRWGRSFPGLPVPMLAGIGVALLAYVTFWLWWLSPVLGCIFSIALPILAGGCWAGLRLGYSSYSGDRLLEWPALLLASLVLLGCLLMGVREEISNLADLASERYIPDLPDDNELPYRLARHVADRRGPGILCGDWLTSDRPPLQAGWTLQSLPWLEIARIPPGTIGLVTGLWLQMIWWLAVGALMDRLGATPRVSHLIRVALLPMGFFALNSVYVWPKLAAGGFFLGGWLAAEAAYRHPRNAAGLSVIAGLSSSLGWLAHGGVAFAALAALPLLPWWVRRVGLRPTGLLIATICCLTLPWLLYVTVYDPPGNRLVKLHLADVKEVDERSSMTAITQTYREMDWSTWWNNHHTNAAHLVGKYWSSLTRFNLSRAEARRYYEFAYTGRTMGWWNLGWLALLVIWIRRWQTGKPIELPACGLVLSWVAGTLVIWWLLMLKPHATSIHQGSYTTLLTMLPILAWALFRALPAAFVLVAALQFVVFVTTWLPLLGDEVHWGHPVAICVAVLGWVALVGAGFLCPRHSPRRDDPAL